MGKITAPFDVSKVEDPEDFRRFVSQWMKQAQQIVMGLLTFGENIQSKQVDVTFTAGATPTRVQHGLGYIPTGYLQVGASTDLVVYGLRGSDWNADAISLQANKAGTAKLIVF